MFCVILIVRMIKGALCLVHQMSCTSRQFWQVAIVHVSINHILSFSFLNVYAKRSCNISFDDSLCRDITIDRIYCKLTI